MCHMAREVEVEVCQECYRNCLLIHRGKHDHSWKVLTFFKVMFGKNIEKLLVLPPKFSRKHASLVGKKSYIEDSTGRKWKVVLSDVEGSLAFKKGWDQFFQYHGIEKGDLLVFHYIEDSHFFVTIYGRSGCEKPVPGQRSYQNKRLKTTRDSTTKKYSSYDERKIPKKSGRFNAFAVSRSDTDSILSQDDLRNKSFVVAENVPKADVLMEPCFLTDEETTFAKEDDLIIGNKLVVAENVPKTDVLMDPYFLNDRETTFAKEDDREHLLDLSIFELPDMKPIIAMQGDKDHLIDLPTSDMANNNRDVREDHREHLFDMPSIELPDENSSFAKKGDENYISDLSTSKLTDKKVDANYIGELQVQGNTCSQVLGALHRYQPGDVSIDLAKKTGLDMPSIELPDVNPSYAKKGDENYLSDLSTSELTDKKVDANYIGELQVQGNTCSQVLSALHKYQPGDASIDLAKKTGLSQANTVLPSKKTEAKPLKSECIPVPSVSPRVSMPLNSVMPLKTIKKFDTFEPSAASGDTMRVVKREPKEFGRGLFDKVVDDSPGLKLDPMEDDVPDFSAVKTEPVDFCDSDSSPTIRIKCSIPSDSEPFLVLPEALP